MKPSDPLAGMTNPLMGMMAGQGSDVSEEFLKKQEEDREREVRLLGTMLFHAFFLSMCILLYDRWSWSQFSNSYESMLFWFMASFAVQAGFYFIYRAAFEHTSSHRKSLKQLKQQSRRTMTNLKYQHERMQLEQALAQQSALFQNTLNTAMSDGTIDAQENVKLEDALKQILETLGSGEQDPPLVPQTLQPQGVQQLTPEELGIDRNTIMGIPMGPSLVYPQQTYQVPMEAPIRPHPVEEKQNLDLTPQEGSEEENQ